MHVSKWGVYVQGMKKEGPALRGTPILMPLDNSALATAALGRAGATWSHDSRTRFCWPLLKLQVRSWPRPGPVYSST